MLLLSWEVAQRRVRIHSSPPIVPWGSSCCWVVEIQSQRHTHYCFEVEALHTLLGQEEAVDTRLQNCCCSAVVLDHTVVVAAAAAVEEGADCILQVAVRRPVVAVRTDFAEEGLLVSSCCRAVAVVAHRARGLDLPQRWYPWSCSKRIARADSGQVEKESDRPRG